MYALDRLVVFQYYPPKTNFENTNGWKWAPMRMRFGIKQQYLRHKSRLFLGGYVLESSEDITYSLTIKGISVRLMVMIAVKYRLGLMSEDIGNAFCTAPFTENIWSTCVQVILLF